MGPSGSGKSTLMHCLAGLDTVDSGRVFVGDVELAGLGDKQLTRMRRDRIGFVFQSFNLLPTLTALGLGVAVGWALQDAMASEGVEVLSISLSRLGLYLLSAIAIGVLAAIWPAWRAVRMRILDAIHHQ